MDLSPWGIAHADVHALPGGWNSQTWSVGTPTDRFVAKRVMGERARFEAGLLIVEALERRGMPSGAPVRTRSGALSVADGDGVWLALLRFVTGTPTHDFGLWGTALGRAHRLLADLPPPDALTAAPAAGSASTDRRIAEVAPWVPDALASAHAAAAVEGLTAGILHNDGAETLHDPESGALAVIDWGGATVGPLVSDVATVLWQLRTYGDGSPFDFTTFVDAYAAEAPVAPWELDQVEAFVRVRIAASGWYFAHRLTDRADDWSRTGLEEARQQWERFGG